MQQSAYQPESFWSGMCRGTPSFGEGWPPAHKHSGQHRHELQANTFVKAVQVQLTMQSVEASSPCAASMLEM